MADATKMPDMYQLEIGNIQPGQEAVVTIELQQEMAVQGGVFSYSLPWALYPDPTGEG